MLTVIKIGSSFSSKNFFYSQDVAFVDLNDDGKQELVLVDYNGYCNSDGCSMVVYDPASPKEKKILSLSEANSPLILLDKKVNGWRDFLVKSNLAFRLISNINTNPINLNDSDDSYNLPSYPSNPLNEIVYDGSIDGLKEVEFHRACSIISSRLRSKDFSYIDSDYQIIYVKNDKYSEDRSLSEFQEMEDRLRGNSDVCDLPYILYFK